MKCPDIGKCTCLTCGREYYYSQGKELTSNEANDKLLEELNIKSSEILLIEWQMKEVEQLLIKMLNEIAYMADPIKDALKRLKEIKEKK